MPGEMPDVFDRLQERVEQWSATLPDTPPGQWVLSSDRELSGSDPQERVMVTIRNFEVASIRVDPVWYGSSFPSLEELEDRIRQAVNMVWAQYWAEEVAAAQEAYTPMGEIAAGLQELSVVFRGAYEKAVQRLDRHV